MLTQDAKVVIFLNDIMDIEACMYPCIHSINVGKHYFVNDCMIIICGKILVNLKNMLNI